MDMDVSGYRKIIKEGTDGERDVKTQKTRNWKNRSGKFDWTFFLKSIAVIGVPVALQNLLSTTGSMIETMMLAAIGEKAVGAVGLCAQFSSLMFSCYWGFVGGGMMFFSQYWGAKDEDGINRSYGVTLSFMMGVALIFAVLAMGFPQVVMGIYTDKEEIQKIGISYLRLVGLAYPMQATCHGYECTAALHRAGKSTSIWWDRSRDVQLFL